MIKMADVRLLLVLVILVTVIFQAIEPAFALDPDISLNQYVLDEWSTDNGLPSNVITTMGQTIDGYTWFGTGKGLVRFDGGKFTVFDKKNTPELSNDYINELYFSKTGDLWIGINEGLIQYHNRTFKKYSKEDGLSSNFITDIFEDFKGNLWVGTQDGYLNCIKNGKIEIFSRENGLEDPFIFSIYEDNQGRLMVSTKEKGLYLLENERFKLLKINHLNYTGKVVAQREDKYGYSFFVSIFQRFRLTFSNCAILFINWHPFYNWTINIKPNPMAFIFPRQLKKFN